MLILISLASFSIAEAQSDDYFYVDPDDKTQLDLGVKMGLSMNGFTGNLFENQSPSYSFTGSVYHRLPISSNKKLTLYNEIGIGLKGANFYGTQDSFISKITLFYFDFPIGFEYQLKEVKNLEKGSTTYRIFLGIQPSILARSSLFWNTDKESLSREFGLPLTAMDYSVVAGVPVEFPVGYGKMGFSISVKYGLRDINKNMRKFSAPNFASGNEIKNWQIILSMSF